jgi:hypothetical protein
MTFVNQRVIVKGLRIHARYIGRNSGGYEVCRCGCRPWRESGIRHGRCRYGCCSCYRCASSGSRVCDGTSYLRRTTSTAPGKSQAREASMGRSLSIPN